MKRYYFRFVMPIIKCPSCTLDVVLPANYDNFEGEIKCESCESLFEVDIKDGDLRQIDLIRKRSLK